MLDDKISDVCQNMNEYLGAMTVNRVKNTSQS